MPPPALTPRELEHADRQLALLSLDPAVMRAWAERWGVPLLPSSDEDLLFSMHQAISRDTGLPMAARMLSLRWLTEHGDEVAAAAWAELELT